MKVLRYLLMLVKYRKWVIMAAFLAILLAVWNIIWNFRAAIGPGFFLLLGLVCFIGGKIHGELIYYYAALGSLGLAWIAFRLESSS